MIRSLKVEIRNLKYLHVPWKVVTEKGLIWAKCTFCKKFYYIREKYIFYINVNVHTEKDCERL